MSINEHKHPGIVESALEGLSSYEKKKFEKFRDMLSPEFDDITDYTLFRFLKQNTWYTTPAEKQFRAYIDWRNAKGLNNRPIPVPKKQAVQRSITPHGYHGHDKEGRPVYIEKTGKIDCNRLVDENVLSTDEYLEGHIWGIEHLMQLCFEQSKVLGRRVETFTSIIDMEGLSLNHRIALPRLNQAMSLDSQYYPYFVGKLFILHTPFMAPLVYSAVSPFVPKEVRDRMYVLKNNEALLAYVEADELPVELGGTCHLHGGVTCINSDDYNSSMSPRHAGDHEALFELHPELQPELHPSHPEMVRLSSGDHVPTLTTFRLPQQQPQYDSNHDDKLEMTDSERTKRAQRGTVV